MGVALIACNQAHERIAGRGHLRPTERMWASSASPLIASKLPQRQGDVFRGILDGPSVWPRMSASHLIASEPRKALHTPCIHLKRCEGIQNPWMPFSLIALS